MLHLFFVLIGKFAYASPGKGRDLEKLWLDFFFVLFVVVFEDCIYQQFNITVS